MCSFFQICLCEMPGLFILYAQLLYYLFVPHAGSDKRESFFQLQVPRGQFQSKFLEVEPRDRIGDKCFEIFFKIGQTDIRLEFPMRDLNADIFSMYVHPCHSDKIEQISEISVCAASEMVGVHPYSQQWRAASVECFFE